MLTSSRFASFIQVLCFLPFIFLGNLWGKSWAAAAEILKTPVLFRTTSSSVVFRAVANPGSIRVIGRSVSLSANFRMDHQEVSGAAELDLSSLDTGISLRNQHMTKNYLETEQFPRVSFLLLPFKLPTSEKVEIPFQGKLSLHGIEKQVFGTASIQRSAPQIRAVAEFKIQLSDFKIQRPRFAGIAVADEIAVQVDQTMEMISQ